MKLPDRKSALTTPHPHPPTPAPTTTTPVVYSTVRSKAVVPVLVLLFFILFFFFCFVVYSTRRFVLCLALCYFVLVFFSTFSIAITPLGEERAFGKRELVLVFFVRLFDLRLFGFDCFLFLLVSGMGCGL